DEAHFLGDEDRGVVWEEIMIYLPFRIPLLLLSATIGNAHQIAAWLSAIRSKACAVIEETQRPVPLFPLFFHPSGTLLPLTAPDQSESREKIYGKVHAYLKAKPRRRFGPSAYLPPFDAILQVLKKFHLLPAIFFLKSRSDCDQALDQCHGNLLRDPQRQAELERKVREMTKQSPHIFHHRQLWHLKHLAVGAHHAGQLPAWKLLLEKLMTQGLLDAVFATSTVAAGVNFPARTVVFLNTDRFNGRHFLPLNPTELHQMTGRAGRRGMDNIGFALAIPGKFMDIRLLIKLLQSPPSDVISQIKINFSMVLNLLLSHTPDQIAELLQKSFATYLIAQSKKRKHPADVHRYLWQDFLRHLKFLQETGYVTAAGKLSEEGTWTSQLRVDQPLMIAEGFRRGVLLETDPAVLAGIIAAFVNERESDDRLAAKRVPQTLLKAFFKVTKSLKHFSARMTSQGFDVRPLFLRPAGAIYAWAGGQPWETVLRLADLEEGDLAMLILRTADNLRHIRALGHVFPATAKTASQAIDLILREPVATEDIY
ncbi:MAG: ATP-dependent DNA helicase, partial [Desulfobacterales bacterium]